MWAYGKCQENPNCDGDGPHEVLEPPKVGRLEMLCVYYITYVLCMRVYVWYAKRMLGIEMLDRVGHYSVAPTERINKQELPPNYVLKPLVDLFTVRMNE